MNSYASQSTERTRRGEKSRLNNLNVILKINTQKMFSAKWISGYDRCIRKDCPLLYWFDLRFFIDMDMRMRMRITTKISHDLQHAVEAVSVVVFLWIRFPATWRLSCWNFRCTVVVFLGGIWAAYLIMPFHIIQMGLPIQLTSSGLQNIVFDFNSRTRSVRSSAGV